MLFLFKTDLKKTELEARRLSAKVKFEDAQSIESDFLNINGSVAQSIREPLINTDSFQSND